MPRGLWLLLVLAVPPLAAQVEVSAGAGIGSIRYGTGNSLATVTLSPAVAATAPWGTGGGAAAVGPLGGGRWAGQLHADGWAAWPTPRALRPAAALAFDGSVQQGGPATGAGHALGELVWVADGHGAALGVGPSVGGISGSAAATAFRVRGRAWGRIGRATASATLEPQRLEGAWFTDVTFGVATPPAPITVGAWLAGRMSEAYQSRIAGSVSAQIAVGHRVALEAAGGSYLPDLYQGFPASAFVALGARVFLGRRPTALRGDDSPRPALGVRDGDSVVVRFRVPRAARVAIAGEWSDWQAVPLLRAGVDVWQGRLALTPGTYRFTLVVDGARWIVPAGVAAIPDGMGGEQGLLIVP